MRLQLNNLVGGARLAGLCAIAALTIACTEITPFAGPAGSERIPFVIDSQVRFVADDLIHFSARSINDSEHKAVSELAACRIANEAEARGYEYMRHIRTSMSEQGGILSLDTVYTLSRERPLGDKILSASATANRCRKQRADPT